jgi:ABC-type thiamin/hydroxymethylpyrimidine transport system permease subunit
VAIEKWVGGASLAWFILFVAEILSLFNFLAHASPTDLEGFDIGPKVLEFISIGIGPALILAGLSYLLSRRYGSRLIGSMVVAGGAILLGGMYYANTLLSTLNTTYLVTEVTLSPPLFMAVSIPVMIIGGMLFKTKPRPKKDYFFDR